MTKQPKPELQPNIKLIARIAFFVYAAVVVWASIRPGGGPQPIEHFDKLMHFVFYGTFAVIAVWCTDKLKTFIQLAAFIIVYGILMEVLQSFVPSRFMSFADIVANSLGVVTACLLLIKWRRFPE